MNVFMDRAERLQADLAFEGGAELAPPASLGAAPYLLANSGPPPAFDPEDAAFLIFGPSAAAAPVVFASPHSGRKLPSDMVDAARWPEPKLAERLGKLEDRFVDELFASAPAAGAVLLTALIHRAYIDLNREPYELDPGMVCGDLPAHANIRSPRVAAGLGAIARAVGEAGEIYGRKLKLAEVEARLDRVHRPYHQTLTTILNDQKSQFGRSLLVDCHSMPSTGSKKPAEIVLGDRFGGSCAPWLVELADSSLTKMGFEVARNAPYAGGYGTQKHGAPSAHRHALQIEIRRDLYMDEQFLVKNYDFQYIKGCMAKFSAILCDAMR